MKVEELLKLGDENRKLIIKEVTDHAYEMVLDDFHVVRLEGFEEDDDDYYYVLYDHLQRGRYYASFVGAVTFLKGQISDRAYNCLESLFYLNGFDGSCLLRPSSNWKSSIKTIQPVDEIMVNGKWQPVPKNMLNKPIPSTGIIRRWYKSRCNTCGQAFIKGQKVCSCGAGQKYGKPLPLLGPDFKYREKEKQLAVQISYDPKGPLDVSRTTKFIPLGSINDKPTKLQLRKGKITEVSVRIAEV